MSDGNYIDDTVMFDGGPTLRRRAFPELGLMVVEPSLGEVSSGCRVLLGDEQGIGLAVDDGQSAVVSSVFCGTQLVAIPDGARRLPTSIEASLRVRSGEWVGRDMTEIVLSLSIDELHSLRDGSIPDILETACGSDVVEIEISSAVSFYFGHMPAAKDGALAPAPRISFADLEQARVIDRDLRSERSPELAP